MVQVSGVAMYTGQAVMLRSCATGCHSSNTSGAGRQGAPAGLNFDLIPVEPGALITGATGITGVSAEDPIALAGLRARQRKVFDEREGIWEQIDKGLMPPGKLGEKFKDLMAVVGFTFDPVAKGCPEGEKLTTLDNAKEELRNWLACGVPVVETSSAELPYKALDADAGAAESAAGTHAYAGQVGYQYPACEAGDAGMVGGFDEVYKIITKLDYACLGCHAPPAVLGNFDLGTTIDTAYTKLLGADGTGGMTTCAAKPKYIVPNNTASSYLLTMVDAKATGRCTGNVMPLGGTGWTTAELKTLTDWINAGAKR